MVTRSRPAQGRTPSGYSAWRLIAEELRGEIVAGVVPVGSKLPSESELAQRFEVHRHTVRQAVAALAAEQLVVARRGSGTFVAEHDVVVHRIGVRTRLNDSLGPRGLTAPGRLIETAVEPDPPADVARRLGLGDGAARRLEVVRSVEGRPISRVTSWFDAGTLPGIAEEYREVGSMTVALRNSGVPDYVRAATSVSGRLATAAEAEDLQLPAGSVVLVVRALDTHPDGRPLLFNVTRFAADRVELDVDHPEVSPPAGRRPGRPTAEDHR
ncbi:phosphonate metabolism transcriptional regulator PhnF [Kineococcus sp. NBC_00420]|uniref:phosphonate metabolism transcriptional regulator PhnF n=1 Tax=unclassified Kineococcus TaxID=2621656 RepID=UPI002E21B046